MTTKPEGKREVSRYMRKLFADSFDGEVCEFWTGENGMLMSLVTKDDEGAETRLRDHFTFGKHESFDPTRMRKTFVDRQWVEYGEGANGNQIHKRLWTPSETVTPFPVIIYDLEVPL